MKNSGLTQTRLLQLEELLIWREATVSLGEKVGLTNGCFDLIHVGHLRCLEAAADHCDKLVVAINGNESVRALKGPTRPIVDEFERAELIAGLRCVAAVTIFHTPRLDSLVRELRPDVYLKGGDYTLETLNKDERLALEACNTEINFFQTVEGKSTTNLVNKLNNF